MNDKWTVEWKSNLLLANNWNDLQIPNGNALLACILSLNILTLYNYVSNKCIHKWHLETNDQSYTGELFFKT